MGSADGEGSDNERPQHWVTVEPFWMGKYPVTQAQWRAIATLPKVDRELTANPSYFEGDSRPVERVSWRDAVEFCKRLSQRTGQNYRLPSEAEWEYACRAGTTTPFHFGETLTSALANYDADSTCGSELASERRQQTTSVDNFPANTFGLYDMHGNVDEWCADHWHDSYTGAPTDGSTWLSAEENSGGVPSWRLLEQRFVVLSLSASRHLYARLPRLLLHRFSSELFSPQDFIALYPSCPLALFLSRTKRSISSSILSPVG